jgi:aldose 1-epimerase
MTAATDLLRLRAGTLELELSPSIGGAIHGLYWIGGDGRTPLLRPCNSSLPSVLDMASFPLVPFVNRIRAGRFSFRGREVELGPNMAGDVSPLHGQGWLGSWSVAAHGDRSAELLFMHEPGEWPWRYQARQIFALDERGLTVRLLCQNLDDRPMPCGLGQHPYFPCGPETRLDTDVEVAWEIDQHVLPTRQVSAQGRFDLKDRVVCGQDLDHGFGGWGRSARMSDPNWPATLTMSSPQARFFQLYSPPTGGIFVAEPVTHANAALNEPEERWAELGLEILEPGAEMALDMRVEVSPK